MVGQAAEQYGVFDLAASTGLFVGVSIFEDERFPAVPFAVDDAVDLAYLFTLELRLVSPKRSVLLLAGEPRKPESIDRLKQLITRGAHRASARQRDIYQYLGKLTRISDERGIAIITIATHGMSDQGGDFLVATDSLRERTLRTGVAVNELLDEVAKAGAKRRLVLLDACRERLGQDTRGEDETAMAASFANAIAHAMGLVVLSGATLGGFAYDDFVRENGVFTAAVLDGLRGEAPASPEGWITVRTLADFVQQKVTSWVLYNRPDHAAKSLGIARHIEATAETLPLAPHPEIARALQHYRARREMALTRVKDNQGSVLSGALWDQIVAWLPAESPNPGAERLLSEIEALDGTERSQRSLRDFLRELTGGGLIPSFPLERHETSVGQEASQAAVPMQKMNRAKLRLEHALVPLLLLAAIIASYFIYLAVQQQKSMERLIPGPKPIVTPLEAGKSVEISILGKVVNQRGTPLSGAQVSTMDEKNESTQTDPNGLFVLRPFISKGQKSIEVRTTWATLNSRDLCFVDRSPCIIVIKALFP